MSLESIALAMPGINEILIILVLAGIFIFGAKKIPELAKTLGKAKGEFEKGKIEGEKELKDLKNKEKTD
jgi:sec-independent protein translocase protein TatA